MRLSSLVSFAVVLIIALQTLPTSGKVVKPARGKAVATRTTTTTTTTTPVPSTKALPIAKKPVKFARKVIRRKKKPAAKRYLFELAD